ncbi:Site-specific recombinase [Methylophaga frappieri]|uniref:Site-specific recombinase n=1 Tax=Methylophaga frappieri (strain ATCC BAA-2434 / DSM 25690 / JAM7) TaxID=754477 RepID=I1YJS9_METFJ|nr:site-specific recombinase [Methylophaga frappieri]AFJ03172.1 Site-specific recombinase [Methylophaga frappieri]
MPQFFDADKLKAEFHHDNSVLGALRTVIAELRKGGEQDAATRMDALLDLLDNDTELRQLVGERFHEWFVEQNLYSAIVSLGIFSRRGFLNEFMTRLYDKMNPPPLDLTNAKDALTLLFSQRSDNDWLETISSVQWLKLHLLLCQDLDVEIKQRSINHFKEQCLYAIEMLAIWVAAEELEPELMRIDKRLVDNDSAFIVLQRELQPFVQNMYQRFNDPEVEPYNPDHIWVMLDQCRELVQRLRRRGAGAAGSSISVAHLLERLEQTLERIEELLTILTDPDPLSEQTRCLSLWQKLVLATTEKNSLKSLVRNSIGMLSRSITQNKSDHGEHYVARDKSAFWALFGSAAGAGVLIALMALNKIYIEDLGFDKGFYTLLVSLNYGVGFMIVHMLHFTIASKQPAMTAANFAAEVERGENGRAVHKKLASLLIEVNRSQWAAVWGNVITAIIIASLIASFSLWYWQTQLIQPSTVNHLLNDITPIGGMAIFYASIAGVWLFCSGIIAGYFDNRADYLELRTRIRYHPLLRDWMKESWRENLGDYVHTHYGSLAGNFFFGVLLGITPYIGYLLDLPLDIRHVAFSAANLGYATFSSTMGIFEFFVYLLFVLIIGFFNLWVSFALALIVALRARGTRISRFSALMRSIWDQTKENPLRVFFPVGVAQQVIKSEQDNSEQTPSGS